MSDSPTGLKRLQTQLAFSNVVDVWTALCEEKSFDPKDAQMFVRFLRFLSQNKIKVHSLSVCPKTQGWEGELARRAARFFKAPLVTFVIRIDTQTVSKLSSFNP